MPAASCAQPFGASWILHVERACSEFRVKAVRMKVFSSLTLALIFCAVPAFANVNVISPANGAMVASPFGISATATPCSSQPITAMGWSLDNSSNTAIVGGAVLNAQVGSGNGAHVVHIKSWGAQGAVCVTDVPVNVVPPATAAVPSASLIVGRIQSLTNWEAAADNASGNGQAWGTTQIVGAPATSGVGRQFVSHYSNYSGERYFTTFGADTAAHNFLYDGWIYLAGSGDIANIEMDLNQVMSNGQTVIFGVQCDGFSNTWDYTLNAGNPWNPSDQWRHSYAKCNPRSWSTYAWHHVQMMYSRDNAGNVTYKTIWFDNVENPIWITVPSAFALGWGPVLLTNFQVDGLGGSGSSTVYMDNLTVYRWQ